jgi:hypothetical protein
MPKYLILEDGDPLGTIEADDPSVALERWLSDADMNGDIADSDPVPPGADSTYARDFGGVAYEYRAEEE